MKNITVKIQMQSKLKNPDNKRIFSIPFSHGMKIFGEKSVKKWLEIGIFDFTEVHGKMRKIEE